MSGSYFLYGSILEKCGNLWAEMAGLGKYHMGGYGRIGVYRVRCGSENYMYSPENSTTFTS